MTHEQIGEALQQLFAPVSSTLEADDEPPVAPPSKYRTLHEALEGRGRQTPEEQADELITKLLQGIGESQRDFTAPLDKKVRTDLGEAPGTAFDWGERITNAEGGFTRHVNALKTSLFRDWLIDCIKAGRSDTNFRLPETDKAKDQATRDAIELIEGLRRNSNRADGAEGTSNSDAVHEMTSVLMESFDSEAREEQRQNFKRAQHAAQRDESVVGAAKPQTGGQQPPEVVDGPFGLDGFRWGSLKPRSGLASTPFRLLSTLWKAKDRTMCFRDLAKNVWDDGEINLRDDNRLGSARRAVNKFMEAGAFPFKVKTSSTNEVATLVDLMISSTSPPKSAAGTKARKSPRTARQ